MNHKLKIIVYDNEAKLPIAQSFAGGIIIVYIIHLINLGEGEGREGRRSRERIGKNNYLGQINKFYISYTGWNRKVSCPNIIVYFTQEIYHS